METMVSYTKNYQGHAIKPLKLVICVFFLKNLKTTDYLGSITNMTNQKSRLLKKVSYSVSKIAK